MTATDDHLARQILRRFSRQAMATTFEIIFPWQCERAEESAADVFELVERLENQLTVFNERSEVSRFNRLGAKAEIPLESDLFDLLVAAKGISLNTGGAFDLTTGPLTKAWGFFRRAGSLPDSTTIEQARSLVGMQKLQLNLETRRAQFKRPGMEINLGAIGKGYALDRMAIHLKQRWQQQNFLLSAGTSSILAAGQPDHNSTGWSVGVQHPWQPRRIGRLCLRDRAMASSGAKHQHFAYNGRMFGHVIDPRSGWPAEGVALAVVVTKSAAEADALSTSFFVSGVEGAKEYCGERRETAAFIIPTGDDSTLVAFNAEELKWISSDATDCYATASDDP